MIYTELVKRQKIPPEIDLSTQSGKATRNFVLNVSAFIFKMIHDSTHVFSIAKLSLEKVGTYYIHTRSL